MAAAGWLRGGLGDGETQLLRDPLVDRVYRKHRKPLERIFAFYGGQDGDMSINVEEFSLMLKQIGIMPQYLDQQEVVQLFQCIQKEEIGEEEGAAEVRRALSRTGSLSTCVV